MNKVGCFSISLIFLIGSCKTTHQNIAGLYRLDKFPKTTIRLNADGTFEFTKDRPNPYLHPFDHPDEAYWNTKGQWIRVDKKTISVSSQADTMVYPLVSVRTSPPRDKNNSTFAFYDVFGDTVKLLYTQFPNGSIAARMHGMSPSFIEDLTKIDTLEFHFYGYRPFKFVADRKVNQDYSITLTAEFKPNFFQSTEFAIKRNRLIDVKRKRIFRRAEL